MADIKLSILTVDHIADAVKAVSDAIRADLELDLKLAELDPEYREALIEQRLKRLEFWNPALALFGDMRSVFKGANLVAEPEENA